MSDQHSKDRKSVEEILDRTFTDIDRLERLLVELSTQECGRAVAAEAFRALHFEHGTAEGLAVDDAELLADVRSNTERLLSALTRWLIDLTMSGSVEPDHVDAIAHRARAAMEVFAAAPAAAPGTWALPAAAGHHR